MNQKIQEPLIPEEIPFELLAISYPSLLDEWYPGYPGRPREMTVNDPICTLGFIKNGKKTFKDFPELEDVPFSDEKGVCLEGEYKIWLKSEGDSWFIYTVTTINDSI
jgi:hypothetical protein